MKNPLTKQIYRSSIFALSLFLSHLFSFSQTENENLNVLLKNLRENEINGDLISRVKHIYPEFIVHLEYRYNPIEHAKESMEIMKKYKISITDIIYNNPSEIFKKNGTFQITLESEINYSADSNVPPPNTKVVEVFISEDNGTNWYLVPIRKSNEEYLQKYYPYLHEDIIKIFVIEF